MLRVVDTHAHLADLEDLDGAIKRAEEATVFAIVAAGTSFESNMKTLQIAEKYANSPVRVLPALGLHPWGLEKEKIEPTILQIKQNIEEAAGVGEVGLDYWLKDVRKDPVKQQIQQLAFGATLALAKQFDKPVTVHSRGAWEDCFDLIVNSGAKRAIFHWFSGPVSLLKRIVDRGFFVSATPAVAHSRDHRAAILEAPLESLVLETDSPVKYGEMVSEPKDVTMTLSEVSRLKHIAEDKVAEVTTSNFLLLFNHCFEKDESPQCPDS